MVGWAFVLLKSNVSQLRWSNISETLYYGTSVQRTVQLTALPLLVCVFGLCGMDSKLWNSTISSDKQGKYMQHFLFHYLFEDFFSRSQGTLYVLPLFTVFPKYIL